MFVSICVIKRKAAYIIVLRNVALLIISILY